MKYQTPNQTLLSLKDLKDKESELVPYWSLLDNKYEHYSKIGTLKSNCGLKIYTGYV